MKRTISANPPWRAIAILNPLGDFGTNHYCHELAEGLGANGATVAFFTGSMDGLPQFREHYRLFPVLNSVLYRRINELKSAANAGRMSTPEPPYSPTWVLETISAKPTPKKNFVAPGSSRLRKWFLTWELALYLRTAGYGVVWTQWPMNYYLPGFWRICRFLGLRVVHSVHNVVPHEEDGSQPLPPDPAHVASHLLITHSEFARRELVARVPSVANKVAVVPIGLYSTYPRRPEARERIRGQLNISEDQVVILFCGAIRPYKNLDAVLEALADERCRNAILIVAGAESHFPDGVPGDPLGRTRRLAGSLGVSHQVRLIPRHLSITEMAELFESGDIKALPYLSGYGSGMLLLAMTYGKHIVATKTGGAEEYLANYPRKTLLEGPDSASVATGLAAAIRNIDASRLPVSLPDLEYPAIGKRMLDLLKNLD